MDKAFHQIDPRGITLNPDGSLNFANHRLRAAAIASATAGAIRPMSENAGTCTNSGTCSSTNYTCNNTGDCSKASNVGACRAGGQPSPNG
ncbi:MULTISPECIES: hypothetical protein [Xanthomonas translucens group]|uniref:Uncharacterized protein n=3 Tax=Xanthomonas translucens group TaxID=3390202 RepID=A0A0K3A1J8_9XANT|nr:hypothetical protein [Xanthomonas translucens]QDI04844.1 hypothetical protein E4A48_15155 [Xanthomonas translucens pv. cerealis]UKE46857.1 hypothetical protein KHA79_17635 [Xanthomonas translucens pv. cerealis]UKE65449.1 hypothetical protein KM547_17595 [Xanthomonas translucens pv. phlei]UKE69215.1 hypothetical protein K8O61_17525 [Xanthomonas translucens pv. pistacia]UKE72954.1 hypothetical protein KFS85_18325 [Xanthomonas translucens pv. phleipratensis]